jgi:hypothetical protein
MKRLMVIGGVVIALGAGGAWVRAQSGNGANAKEMIEGQILQADIMCKPVKTPRANQLPNSCQGEITVGSPANSYRVTVGADTKLYDGKKEQDLSGLTTLQQQATPVKVYQTGYGQASKISY